MEGHAGCKGPFILVHSVITLFMYFFLNVMYNITAYHIMALLCGVHIRVHVRVSNFSSKTTTPRDMLFLLRDTLTIEDDKLFKACRSVHLSVLQSHYK